MARTFNGSSDYVAVLPGVSLSNGTDWSFSAWVRPHTFSGGHNCLFGGSGATPNDQMFAVTFIGGQLAVTIVNVEDASTWATITPTLNTWTHAGCDFNFTTKQVRYWIGGVAAGTSGWTSGGVPPTTRLTTGIGVRYNDGFFDGEIADVACWKTLLASGDYLALAQGAFEPRAIKLNSLIYYAPLCGTSSPEPDLGPQAMSGTVVGATLGAGPPIPSVCNKGVQLSRVAGRGMRW